MVVALAFERLEPRSTRLSLLRVDSERPEELRPDDSTLPRPFRSPRDCAVASGDVSDMAATSSEPNAIFNVNRLIVLSFL